MKITAEELVAAQAALLDELGIEEHNLEKVLAQNGFVARLWQSLLAKQIELNRVYNQ